MERSTQSDQKWKELVALQEEMVLVIRKAFTLEAGTPEPFTLGKHGDKGFGLVSLDSVDEYSYILAYPDLVTSRIRVTLRLSWQLEEEVIYVNCISDLQEAEKSLRRMVLGFLVAFDTVGGITW